jgi:hypothetical protein
MKLAQRQEDAETERKEHVLPICPSTPSFFPSSYPPTETNPELERGILEKLVL